MKCHCLMKQAEYLDHNDSNSVTLSSGSALVPLFSFPAGGSITTKLVDGMN